MARTLTSATCAKLSRPSVIESSNASPPTKVALTRVLMVKSAFDNEIPDSPKPSCSRSPHP